MIMFFLMARGSQPTRHDAGSAFMQRNTAASYWTYLAYYYKGKPRREGVETSSICQSSAESSISAESHLDLSTNESQSVFVDVSSPAEKQSVKTPIYNSKTSNFSIESILEKNSTRPKQISHTNISGSCEETSGITNSNGKRPILTGNNSKKEDSSSLPLEIKKSKGNFTRQGVTTY